MGNNILKTNKRFLLLIISIGLGTFLIIFLMLLLSGDFSELKDAEARRINKNRDVVFELDTRISRGSVTDRNIAKLTNIDGIELVSVVNTPQRLDLRTVRTVTVLLNSSEKVVLEKKSVKSDNNGYTLWTSESIVKNRKYTSMLVTKGTGFAGTITAYGGEYMLNSVGNNTVVVRKGKSSLDKLFSKNDVHRPKETKQKQPESTPGKGFRNQGRQNFVNHDVTIMAAYTIATKNLYGTEDNINAAIFLEVSKFNQSFEDSWAAGSDTMSLTLVGTMEASIPNPNNIEVSLEGLLANEDPSYQEINNKRNEFGADLITLITSPSDTGSIGGRAWLFGGEDKASNVVVGQYLNCCHVLSHEVGHNLGAHHDRRVSDGDNYHYDYGYGKVLYTENVRTVMAYNDPEGCENGSCPIVPYFSTLFKYGNETLGHVETEFNAWAIMESAKVVKDYRAGPIPPTSGPGVTIPPGGGKTCGESCNNVTDCDPYGSYLCIDVGQGGKTCWNENQCGGPALKARISGRVYDCNKEPAANVPVSAWGNSTKTDNNGYYSLNKGVNENNIRVIGTSILAGADSTKKVQDKYYFRQVNKDDSIVADEALDLEGNECQAVNCNYNLTTSSLGFEQIPDSERLMSEGPAREAYRIDKGGTMTDEYFRRNFVFTDYSARSFDFVQINCPNVVSQDNRIIIRAGVPYTGLRGDESVADMELEINGQVVKQFKVRDSSNPSNINFRNYRYTYRGSEPITEIKVNYTNDKGPKDLIIDYVKVDRNTYQSEAPGTFSRGVWTSTRGCSNEGYMTTERLSCNGYFRFDL